MSKTAKELLAENAAQDLYMQNKQRLENYATLLVRDREAARDIVSTAMTSVLDSETSLEANQLIPYIFTTVRNLCLNYRRDSLRHKAVYDHIRQVEGSAFEHYTKLIESSDPKDLFASEIYEICKKQVESMSEQEKELYLLRSDGLTQKEIAEKLGISENQVDKRIRKILKQLRLSLADYLDIAIILIIIGWM